MLKKKSNSIYYHTVRKSVAMGESLTGHIGKNKNLGNIAMKVLYGQKQRYMVSQLLYDIYDDNEMMQPFCFCNPSVIQSRDAG